MALDSQKIDDWYHQMPGEMIFDMEQNMLKKFISHVKGDFLVQVGGPNDLSMVEDSPILHKYHIAFDNLVNQDKQTIISDSKDLPFLDKSINVFVLIHLLEFIDNPTQLLRQMKEQLTPNGYLIIFGFNYWGLWNMARFWKDKDFPWNGHFYSLGAVKHWCHVLNLHRVASRTGCFRLPNSNRKTAERLLFLEPVGQFLFPGMGAFYMMIAQKRVQLMNLQKEKVWWKKYLVGNNTIVKPTTRNL